MFAVWKKGGPAIRLSSSALGQFGNGYRRSASLLNSIEETVHVGSIDNRAFAIPSTATAEGSLRQDPRLSAIGVDNFQLAVGKKSESGAVWRPEWHGCPFGSGELLLGTSRERTDPDIILAIRADCNECQPGSIRRQGGIVDQERPVRRRQERGAHGLHRSRSCGSAPRQATPRLRATESRGPMQVW